jgi:hypothetical protein
MLKTKLIIGSEGNNATVLRVFGDFPQKTFIYKDILNVARYFVRAIIKPNPKKFPDQFLNHNFFKL